MRTKGSPREWSGSCSATRPSPPLTALPVTYATASAEAVAEFVAAHYASAGPVVCSFVNRRFNDTYALRDAEGAQFVLRLPIPAPVARRIWRRRRRSLPTATEQAFL